MIHTGLSPCWCPDASPAWSWNHLRAAAPTDPRQQCSTAGTCEGNLLDSGKTGKRSSHRGYVRSGGGHVDQHGAQQHVMRKAGGGPE